MIFFDFLLKIMIFSNPDPTQRTQRTQEKYVTNAANATANTQR